MKKEQFLIDHFKESDTIECQCLFLQNEFKEALNTQRELKGYKDREKTLLKQIEGLELKIELLRMYPPYRLDERV